MDYIEFEDAPQEPDPRRGHRPPPPPPPPQPPPRAYAPPPPTQTIVIERERKGCFRRLAVPVVVLVLIFLFLVLYNGESAILPSRLTERYVAGDLSPTSSKVAIVEVDGPIMGEAVEHVLKQVRQAYDDDKVKAVVLRVDSPGGSLSGSDRIWREVRLLVDKKPVVVSMGGMAASGGYYISAPANTIFAEPTTMTGSIGVIAEFPEVSELLKKVGVDVETIATGNWKDSGSYLRPMTETERKRWREVLDAGYQRFVRVVAQGRNLPLKDVIEMANGKVYTAQEARQMKLVNTIGYLDDAINDAKTRAGLSTARVIRYHKPLDLRDMLIGFSAPQSSLKLDIETLIRFQTPQVLLLAQ